MSSSSSGSRGPIAELVAQRRKKLYQGHTPPGGAGLSGAIWAAEAGCKVIVLEGEDRIGGSTALSDGVFNAADTSVQRSLGFTDSIDDYYDYYMTLNAWRQPAALIRRFCEEATPTLEWLLSIGVTYPMRVAHKPKQPVFPGSVEGGGL